MNYFVHGLKGLHFQRSPFVANKKQGANAPCFFMAERMGFGVCCGCALHTVGSATEMLRISVPALPLFAKNSPPGCFFYAKTLSGSNPNYKKSKVRMHLAFLMAERMGFEPMWLLAKRFSRPPRYDRFDTSPY